MRTVVFGVDGLTFRILHPLIERGDLPNFKKLSLEGCESTLESKYPPLTPPAWTSLSTGLKPARHGVYDFWMYEQQGHGVARSAHVQTKRKGGKAIWNILSEYGKKVLVINVPVTYPPEAVNGIMISGYMTPSSSADFTYPANFKEELYRIVPDYQIDLDLSSFWRKPRAMELLIDATLRMTEQRIELTTYLLKEKPWDFCYVVFVGPDRLQHSLWEEISSLDTRATEYFRLLDHGLGLILEQLGPDDSLFVVSDHGFQGITQVFNMNEYLYSKGWLTPSSSYQYQIKRAHRYASLKQVLKRFGLLSLARRTRRKLKHAGALKVLHSDVYHPLLLDIDRERTLAYVPSLSGYPGSYVDIFLREDLDAESLIELCEDLKQQVDPRSGQSLVNALYTTEVFGEGSYAPSEPHLLLLPNDGITFRMNLGSKLLWDEASKTRGTHQKDGVLYAYGGGIKSGFKAPDAEIYDLVPTVLYSMGLPLPHAFDGRVLEELFVTDKRNEQMLATVGSDIEGGLARRKLQKLLEM
jgi:predicted AlkP superfamily phosphohydrolase/phosphomutase